METKAISDMKNEAAQSLPKQELDFPSPDQMYLAVAMKMSCDYNAGKIPDYTDQEIIFRAMEEYARIKTTALNERIAELEKAAGEKDRQIAELEQRLLDDNNAMIL